MVPRQKVNTLELDAIRPTIPGIGLICTPRSLSITFLNKLKRKKNDHYNNMQQKKCQCNNKRKKMQVRWATWICLFLIIDLFVLSRHNLPYSSIFSLWGFMSNLCSTFPSIATLPEKECNFLPKLLTIKKPWGVL